MDTQVSVNGDERVELDPSTQRTVEGRRLPTLIHLAAGEARRIPAPGTQRALKAETGRTFDQMCGPEADGADRIQTLIWMKLRREFPGLRWADCDDVDVQVEEGTDFGMDPTSLVGSASSPPSADSGD